ncbi:MAG TPA: AMP-binding protein [Polyangiales bacterium]
MTLQPMAAALPGSVEYWALAAPDQLALQEGARRLSYADWNRQADRIAELFSQRAGIDRGDHVALCMQNRLEWFVTQAATAKLGAVLVPISWRLTPLEVQYIVADCRARVFVFDSEAIDAMSLVWSAPGSLVKLALSLHPSDRTDLVSFASAVAIDETVRRHSDRPPQSIVYTSGTTGRPRGVVIKRGEPKPMGVPRPRVQTSAAATGQTDVFKRNLLGAPLNHAAGQASARATLARGGTVYIMPRFDPLASLQIIDRERITTTFLVPTMLNRILNLPPESLAAHDVSSIRVITTGASPCPQSIKEQVVAYFGDHCLIESYGTTEVGLIARMLPSDHLKKPGSCGRLLDGVQVRILDERSEAVELGGVGEIWVKTPSMIERYLNEPPPKELIGGFFATGDIGRFDEDGYLYVIDRKKDMIIAGGVNIYPAEIEDALRQHPAVLDAAAFGVPHPELGEQVRAVVECVDGSSASEEELLAFIRDRLAAYKRPRAIDFVAEIPRNAAGKPLKNQLRAPYWAGTGKLI